MGWNTDTAAEVPLWERLGIKHKAYRITASGTSIPTGTEEHEIDLTTLAPDVASTGYGWLWACDWAASSGAVSAAPVLGVVTDPAASLLPYVLSFTASLRDGAGPAVLPRLVVLEASKKLFLRPNLNSVGNFRLDFVISQFRGGA